ncbi:hypothetical protein JL721_10820 [Aureococcus anophagefferens]|nr:hypothetical protein JL721_10820 [Aureococcus anophagefferens]
MSDILLQTYSPEHLMSFAPSQQPGGNSYYDYQSCALPSPAVDYSATDAPDVDVSLWIWDAADPDFLTCATTGVSFPNGDFEENTTTLGPTLAGRHVEVTAIKSAYPDGLHQCSACGDTGWRGETRYESDWRYGIYLQGCVDQYKNDFFLTSLDRLARDYASTGNETYAKACKTVDWRDRGHREACERIRDADAAAPSPPPAAVVYGPAPRSDADEARARIAAEHEAARARREANPSPEPLSPRYGPRRGPGLARQRAVELYGRASDLGDVEATVALAYALHVGDGVARDDERALELCRAAADWGHAKAQCNYGTTLYERREFEAAFAYYVHSAHQGFTLAEFYVGRYLHLGLAVDRDLEATKRWYERAAAKGHGAARNSLRDLTEGRREVTRTELEVSAALAAEAFDRALASARRARGELSGDDRRRRGRARGERGARRGGRAARAAFAERAEDAEATRAARQRSSTTREPRAANAALAAELAASEAARVALAERAEDAEAARAANAALVDDAGAALQARSVAPRKREDAEAALSAELFAAEAARAAAEAARAALTQDHACDLEVLESAHATELATAAREAAEAARAALANAHAGDMEELWDLHAHDLEELEDSHATDLADAVRAPRELKDSPRDRQRSRSATRRPAWRTSTASSRARDDHARLLRVSDYEQLLRRRVALVYWAVCLVARVAESAGLIATGAGGAAGQIWTALVVVASTACFFASPASQAACLRNAHYLVACFTFGNHALRALRLTQLSDDERAHELSRARASACHPLYYVLVAFQGICHSFITGGQFKLFQYGFAVVNVGLSLAVIRGAGADASDFLTPLVGASGDARVADLGREPTRSRDDDERPLRPPDFERPLRSRAALLLWAVVVFARVAESAKFTFTGTGGVLGLVWTAFLVVASTAALTASPAVQAACLRNAHYLAAGYTVGRHGFRALHLAQLSADERAREVLRASETYDHPLNVAIVAVQGICLALITVGHLRFKGLYVLVNVGLYVSVIRFSGADVGEFLAPLFVWIVTMLLADVVVFGVVRPAGPGAAGRVPPIRAPPPARAPRRPPEPRQGARCRGAAGRTAPRRRGAAGRAAPRRGLVALRRRARRRRRRAGVETAAAGAAAPRDDVREADLDREPARSRDEPLEQLLRRRAALLLWAVVVFACVAESAGLIATGAGGAAGQIWTALVVVASTACFFASPASQAACLRNAHYLVACFTFGNHALRAPSHAALRRRARTRARARASACHPLYYVLVAFQGICHSFITGGQFKLFQYGFAVVNVGLSLAVIRGAGADASDFLTPLVGWVLTVLLADGCFFVLVRPLWLESQRAADRQLEIRVDRVRRARARIAAERRQDAPRELKDSPARELETPAAETDAPRDRENSEPSSRPGDEAAPRACSSFLDAAGRRQEIMVEGADRGVPLRV